MAMTYVEALEQAIAMYGGEGEVAEKLTALKAQVAKKRSSSKPTKTQVENEAIKEKILEVLLQNENAVTCGEIVKALENEYNPQKISALLRQLKEAGKVVKTTEKKVSRFALA